MTLEQLLLSAAKAAGVAEPSARAALKSLGKSAAATPEVRAFTTALADGLTARWSKLDETQLAAGRAAVSGLERLVREGYDTRENMLKLAEHDAANEKRAKDRYGDGPWRCARCGSERIDDEHTGRAGQRFMQLMCDACGAVIDGMDGDPALEAWRRR